MGDQRNLLGKKSLYVVFGTLATALLFSFVDQNSLAVSLPAISADFNAASTVSWAGTSMLIANTIFQILFGRVSDAFGRKLMLVLSLSILCISQLALSVCSTSTQLYVFRGFAGIGNGGITGLTMMIVSDVVTLKDRGKYQGVLGACVGLGNALGPLLSGYLCSKYSWKVIFYILSPISAIIAVLVFFLLPQRADFVITWSAWRQVDYYGFSASSIGLVCLLVGLSLGGNSYAWTSKTVIALIIVGAVFLILFAIVEWKVSAMPVFPLRLFRNLPLGIILIQNFLFGAVYYSNLYFLPLYFELCRSWSSTLAACMNLPLVLGQALASTISGQLISRTGRYGFVIYIGFSAWFLGSGLQILFNATTSKGVIALVLLVQGIGVGFVFQPTIVAAQAHSYLEDRAVVISVRNFLRSFGGAVGIVVSTAIMTNYLSNLVSNDKELPTGVRLKIKFSAFSIPSDLSNEQRRIFISYLTKLINIVFISYVPLMGVVWFIGWFVRDRGLEHRQRLDAHVEDTELSKTATVVVKVIKNPTD